MRDPFLLPFLFIKPAPILLIVSALYSSQYTLILTVTNLLLFLTSNESRLLSYHHRFLFHLQPAHLCSSL
ncbi:MAG: hypothetical protein K0Q66_2095 [Chitinophagaceae bacterium]|jgi:hypothetical protein|nr:hypothetical protein [Chitinophagaceae bacterium]